MSLSVRLCALVLALGWAFEFTPASIEPARAQGMFGGFFDGPRYAPRNDPWAGPPRRNRAPRYARPDFFGSFWDRRYMQGPPPQVHVSSPRYYTYEPDAPVVVSFAGLAEVETASNSPLEASEATSPFAEARHHLAAIELRVLPEIGEAMNSHYGRYPDFLWASNGRVNANAYAAIGALERADLYGLSARDYLIDLTAYDFSAADPEERSGALIRFEFDMTAAVLGYVLDANRGRVDPNRISGYHDFARKEVDLAGTLLKLAASKDTAGDLEAQNPDNAPFAALAAELARLRETATDTPRVEIAPGTFLRPGASHPELASVVAAIGLMASETLLEDYGPVLDAYRGTPDYTPELVDLVRAFQGENGLHPDGIIGPNTISALVPDTDVDRIRMIELAMERLRWLPRDLGARHVFINAASFTATYMHEGREPLSMRAVVGQKSNQTYFFADRAETVEYNPYWGVPRSIIVNEMLPQLYSDPSYLDRAGYEVTTTAGHRISSSSVDWYGVANDQVSVDVRQPPGAGNALGRVKILFPNAHAIYMHDTPHKDLFQRDARAFSHGCVRLQMPREMAAAVLDQTVEYIDSRIAGGRNDSDEVTASIPVYVAYFTAWPGADGAVHYYDDVYERDMYLGRAIRRTDQIRHAEG